MRKVHSCCLIALFYSTLALQVSHTHAEQVLEDDVLSHFTILRKSFLCYDSVDGAEFVLVQSGLGTVSEPYETVAVLNLLKRLKKKRAKLKAYIKNATSMSEKKRYRKKRKKVSQGRTEILERADSCVSEEEDNSDDLNNLSDEFDSDTLSNFELHSDGPNAANYYETLDIGTSRQGFLTLVPGGHCGWYGTQQGPGLFKLVTGDFIVETYAIVSNKNLRSEPPEEDYNSAGLMVRNPNTTSQNYVMANLGMQSHSNGTGSEAKTTVNGSSQLFLLPGSPSGRMRICRVGSEIHVVRYLANDTEWNITNSFTRNDLPDTVQVGLIVNGWGQTESQTPDDPPDLYAEFDYIRFSRPDSLQDCTAD